MTLELEQAKALNRKLERLLHRLIKAFSKQRRELEHQIATLSEGKITFDDSSKTVADTVEKVRRELD